MESSRSSKSSESSSGQSGPNEQRATKKIKRTRSKLGRGLSALVDQTPIQIMPEYTPKQRANLIQQIEGSPSERHGVSVGGVSGGVGVDQVLELMLHQIVPNPHQPRRVFTQESIEELAESINEHGLLQPIVVRRAVDGADDRYELIAGERRWRASKHAGLEIIRAIVIDVDDLVSAELALIENIQREDLNPLERANGFSLLVERFSMTQDQIAKRVGINRSSVANLLRLLELDGQVQSMIAQGELGGGHGKALLSCVDDEQRLIFAHQAVAGGWSVRFLEGAVREYNKRRQEDEENGKAIEDDQQTSPSRLSLVVESLQRQLSEQLSTRVLLKTDKSGTKGSITIDFYDLDHFDGLMERLGVHGNDEEAGRNLL